MDIHISITAPREAIRMPAKRIYLIFSPVFSEISKSSSA